MMPYPLRVCFEGAIYHVTARGNNREAIFIDEHDYRHYLNLLSRYKKAFTFVLHAYALMPNHVHLIIEPSPQATISKIMHALGVAYGMYFNRRHHHVGHVFQGRFRSRLIERDVYLLVASRYVHRNPSRAKLVAHPEEYPWSSYAAYLKPAGDTWRLVDPTLVLALVAEGQPDRAAQRQAYREFVETPFPSDLTETRSDLKTSSLA